MLRGNAARVCQGDATWSGEEPKCYLDRNIGRVISLLVYFKVFFLNLKTVLLNLTLKLRIARRRCTHGHGCTHIKSK